uniref:Uncharacterized protein n=1 Tax=Micrurus spixii TaxID=129469 RepID=A0A2D4MUD6_9SAUR
MEYHNKILHTYRLMPAYPHPYSGKDCLTLGSEYFSFKILMDPILPMYPFFFCAERQCIVIFLVCSQLTYICLVLFCYGHNLHGPDEVSKQLNNFLKFTTAKYCYSNKSKHILSSNIRYNQNKPKVIID